MSSFANQPALRRIRSVRVSGMAAALLLAAFAPAAAQAKSLKVTITDPAGDGTLSSADILQATAKYTASSGSLRVTVKTAAAMNLRKKNQLVFMFTGTSCKADLFGATAYMNDATAPWAYTLSKKNPVTVNGSGSVTKTVYSANFHGKRLAHLKPVAFQVALFAPGPNGAVMDQTDCVALQ